MTFVEFIQSQSNPDCADVMPLLIGQPDPASYAALRNIVDACDGYGVMRPSGGRPALEAAWFTWKYGPDSLLTRSAMRNGRGVNGLLWRQFEQANAVFAAVNGWIPACRFTSGALAQGKHSGGTDQHPWYDWHHVIDHADRFRLPGTGGLPAAIVAHPYLGNATPEHCRAWARAAGLVAHVCPDADASWWYPGHSYAVAFTRPGMVVRWPDWRAIDWAAAVPRAQGRGKGWGRPHAPAVPVLNTVAQTTHGRLLEGPQVHQRQRPLWQRQNVDSGGLLD